MGMHCGIYAAEYPNDPKVIFCVKAKHVEQGHHPVGLIFPRNGLGYNF